MQVPLLVLGSVNIGIYYDNDRGPWPCRDGDYLICHLKQEQTSGASSPINLIHYCNVERQQLRRLVPCPQSHLLLPSSSSCPRQFWSKRSTLESPNDGLMEGRSGGLVPGVDAHLVWFHDLALTLSSFGVSGVLRTPNHHGHHRTPPKGPGGNTSFPTDGRFPAI